MSFTSSISTVWEYSIQYLSTGQKTTVAFDDTHTEVLLRPTDFVARDPGSALFIRLYGGFLSASSDLELILEDREVPWITEPVLGGWHLRLRERPGLCLGLDEEEGVPILSRTPVVWCIPGLLAPASASASASISAAPPTLSALAAKDQAMEELERAHAEDLRALRAVLAVQTRALEDKTAAYRQKIRELEFVYSRLATVDYELSELMKK